MLNILSEIVSFLWSVADIIRDIFKRGKYQDVILPLTVLRRLDCVLEPTKETVLATHNQYKGRLGNLDPVLRRASGFAFYNTSRYDFDKLLADSHNLADNLRSYINGFSPNMREVLEKFDFDNTIASWTRRDCSSWCWNTSTAWTCTATPFPTTRWAPYRTVTVYDPCSGSGGMLTTAQDRLESLNPQIVVHLFGQEVNPETYAICKSDLYMKSADGREAENIAYGSTLSDDKHAGRSFDYILANPPYGKDWKRDRKAVGDEAKRGHAGRFGAGPPASPTDSCSSCST